MKDLLARLRRTGFLFLIGSFLIIYLALGILYLQQGPKQKALADQITKQSIIALRPLPSAEKLKSEYEEVKQTLTPKAVPEILKILVRVAQDSGIDTDPDNGKFSIPPANPPKEEKVGEGTYQLLSFRNIKVQGDYKNIMAFIAKLDSHQVLKTMVVKKVDTGEVKVVFEGEEKERRAEFREVAAAIKRMMLENALIEIPNPKLYEGEVAVNDMTVFPDILSGWTPRYEAKKTDPKGNPYVSGDKEGYVLFGHDIIADGAQKELVNYIKTATTKYYYTVEKDGRLRQFDGAYVFSAREYFGSEEFIMETMARIDIDIYTKSPETKPAEAKPKPESK